MAKDDLIFTSGSCFAREIEKKLASLGFDVPMLGISTPPEERVSSAENEVLNKYTTASAINELEWAFGVEPFPAAGYLQVGDLYHDPYLHPGVPPVTLERAIERRNEIHELVRVLRKCRLVIFTLGLVEQWYDAETQKYLNGAPPADSITLNPDRFSLHRQSYDDVLSDLEHMYELIGQFGHPEFRMIVSVSPVPFKATFSGQDALSANSYSKSVLRAAAEAFVLRHENVDYFPSYEMVVLSERAETYELDNIHIRPTVVGQIMERAASTYVSGVQPEASAFEDYGKSPSAMYANARRLRTAGEYAKAIKLLQIIDREGNALKTGATEAAFYLLYGTTLARAGMKEEAEAQLYRAVALAPTDARAVYKLGLVSARLKRPSAEFHLQRAIELDPTVGDYHWRLGELYRSAGRLSDAATCFQAALTVEPNHQAAKSSLSRIEGPLAGVVESSRATSMA